MGGCLDCVTLEAISDSFTYEPQVMAYIPVGANYLCSDKQKQSQSLGGRSEGKLIVNGSVETPLDMKTPKISFLELHTAPNSAGGLRVMETNKQL